MNQKISILIGAVALLIIIGAVFFYQKKTNPENTVSSNQEDTLIRAQVTGFGTVLKNVSLLAPEVDLKNQIEQNYKAYLAPELLAAWQADPSQALGKTTSSPWPDHIEIGAVTKQEDSSYEVEGKVWEVTSADQNGIPAGLYPITLTLEEISGTWLITKVEKSDYITVPQHTTIEGTWECLPHRNTSEPQTMECAFGIVTENDIHYALNMLILETGPVDFPTGTRVRVSGTIHTENETDKAAWEKYRISGILWVTGIQKI